LIRAAASTQTFDSIAMQWRFLFKILLGAIVIVFVGGSVVGLILTRIAPWTGVKPPEGVPTEKWQEILGGNPPAAKWLGILESLLAYGSILAFDKNATLVVGGWLAFKVASKWESWQNISRVPESLDDVSEVDFLRARRQWSTTLYLRFLVGTLLNLMFGFLVAIVVNAFR